MSGVRSVLGVNRLSTSLVRTSSTDGDVSLGHRAVSLTRSTGLQRKTPARETPNTIWWCHASGMSPSQPTWRFRVRIGMAPGKTHLQLILLMWSKKKLSVDRYYDPISLQSATRLVGMHSLSLLFCKFKYSYHYVIWGRHECDEAYHSIHT